MTHPAPTPAEHPTDALPPAALASLAAEPSLAVVAIAGRDSIAAAVAAVRERGFRTLLPTIVLTGTEYGDFDAPSRALHVLRERLGDEIDVAAPVWLSSPALWAALNGRYARVLGKHFPGWSSCSACHLYVHMCRIPLSWALGCVPVVTGERETHGGRYKLSQTPLGINAEIEVFAHAGVELLEPIRHVDDEATIAELVGPDWPQGGGQLGCLLSGNYLDLQGQTRYIEQEQRQYVDAFLRPAGLAIVDAWRETPEPDYAAIVERVIRVR